MTNPATLTEHVLQVRAVDLAGNVDDVNGTTVATRSRTASRPPTSGRSARRRSPKTVFCGQKITQSIIVNNNLGDCIGHGLIVGADNITIDLNGKTIDGKSIGAGILNNGYDSVTIKNGRLQDFDFGVMLTNGTKLNIVEGVTAQLNQDAGVEPRPPDRARGPDAAAAGEPLPGFMSGVDDNILRSNSLVSNTRGVWLIERRQGQPRHRQPDRLDERRGRLHRARGPRTRSQGNDIQVASKAASCSRARRTTSIEGNTITDVGTGVAHRRDDQRHDRDRVDRQPRRGQPDHRQRRRRPSRSTRRATTS